MATRVIDTTGLGVLFDALRESGFDLIGPTLQDQAIVYDSIGEPSDLPVGITDVQDGGVYRLEERQDQAHFGYNLGPTSWKKYLYPPDTELFRARQVDGSIQFESNIEQPQRYAFIGVRACELEAIGIQDRVFMGSSHIDRTYESNRSNVFIVAVNCAQAGATCFCDSMGTGPECGSGYDIVLTELIREEGPQYVAEGGSPRGDQIVDSLPGRQSEPADQAMVAEAIATAVQQMGRTMDTAGIRDLLIDNPDHSRWEEVAGRCLICGNCTMACPTCFCSTTVDTVTLDGEAVRSRRWDSCFGLDFSSLHGQPVRASSKSRYRQWMTHKLATWHDQFDSSGCVGCGRCITWCPVGIDITEEVAAIRGTVDA